MNRDPFAMALRDDKYKTQNITCMKKQNNQTPSSLRNQNPPLEGREALSLTKENFWNELNELNEKYPEQMVMFTKWIDEYKERIGWDTLFAHTTHHDEVRDPLAIDSWKLNIKYHDLPIAMQLGIFLQYCLETPHRYELIEGMPGSMPLFAECIKAWFAAEHAFAGSPSPLERELEGEVSQQMEGRLHRKPYYPTHPDIAAKLISGNDHDDMQILNELYRSYGDGEI